MATGTHELDISRDKLLRNNKSSNSTGGGGVGFLSSRSSSVQRDQDGPGRLLARNENFRPHSSASASSSASPSSLQSITTDSDSLQDDQQQQHESSQLLDSHKNHRHHRQHQLQAQGQQLAKSPPVLIKYNYYDYNGERQENHDLNFIGQHNQSLQQQVTSASISTTNNNNLNNNNNTTNKPIQRQLSPTFKQSLDQIVKSTQQRQQQQLSSPLSPAAGNGQMNEQSSNQSHLNGGGTGHNEYTMTLLARRYKLSSYEHRCLRCKKTVYQMDKVGPLKEFTFYHQNCFKCRECGTKLTLKTYFNSQHSSTDLEVYCNRHCPKTPAGKLDNQSVGIRAALNAPKVFDPVHQQAAAAQLFEHNASAAQLGHFGAGYPVANGAAGYNQQSAGAGPLISGGGVNQKQQPQVDSRALHIQHAVQQTRLQSIYKQSQVDKKISQFLNRRLEYLEPKQKMLEMRHREEEEQLFKVFEQKWHQEETHIRDQIREEWQAELNKLLDKYKRQLTANLNANYNNNNSHNGGQNFDQAIAEANLKVSGLLAAAATTTTTNSDRAAKMAAAAQVVVPLSQQQQRIDFHQVMPQVKRPHQVMGSGGNNSSRGLEALDEQRMMEMERLNLEKTMTIKLDRRKETLKRKLKEFERQATAELVEKQSREMLTLISMKLDEFKEEQKRKIGSDLEHFEAIESLANQLGASLQISATATANGKPMSLAEQQQQQQYLQQQQQQPYNLASSRATGRAAEPLDVAAGVGRPAPKAPLLSKMDLYNSEQADEVFKEIDELAINVAKKDQRTFTDLVHHLTRHCLTDVEKVRAIFRWITVKNLNTMQFDSTIKADTPLGLLRGIKQGSESYHVLFKRLCSYAGLHCVVIKGYSKSAGYQPGVRFEGNRFRNSWNAVYVAGAWRFVQCNWGARHLVSVAVMQGNSGSNSNGSSSNNSGRSAHQPTAPIAANLGRRAVSSSSNLPPPPPPTAQYDANGNHQLVATNLAIGQQRSATSNNAVVLSPSSPVFSSSSSYSSTSTTSSSSASACPSPNSRAMQQPTLQANGDQQHQHRNHHQHHHHRHHHHRHHQVPSTTDRNGTNGLQQQQTRHRDHNQAHRVGGDAASSPCSPPSSLSPPSSTASASAVPNDNLRYEYDDHYFLTDPDEFIYEFFPVAPEWQLLKTRPLTLTEFEQLPFVRSLFFKYGLYFAQSDIKSVLYTNSSGATTIKIGMPTHMIPSLIFHYNLKYFESDVEHCDGISLKRFVMQSVESGAGEASADGQQVVLSNIVSFRVHVPENGAYILDIFANSTTPRQYITGEPMKFKSVCKFKIIAKNLKTVMVPLPDCASGEYGPMKATRLFGIIPITHESGLITVQNVKRFLEIQFRMTRPLLDFMASLHKNGHDERQLSKLIKIFIDGDIVFITIKFVDDGQYGLDIYTRDQQTALQHSDLHYNNNNHHQQQQTKKSSDTSDHVPAQAMEPKKQLLTHCCKYLINVRAPTTTTAVTTTTLQA